MNAKEQEQELKKLPYSCEKKKLMAMYLASGLPEKEIRMGINTIISDNRNLAPGKYVFVRRVWHDELMEFVETYGLPKGYKKDDTK